MGTHFWCISRRSKVVVSMGTSTVPEPGPPRGGTFLHKYQKQCSLWEPFLDLGTCISHQEMPHNARSLISFSYTPVAMLQMASSNDFTTLSVQQYSCASYRLGRRHRSDKSSWSNSKMDEKHGGSVACLTLRRSRHRHYLLRCLRRRCFSSRRLRRRHFSL